MTDHRISDWQFWNSIACARIPVRLLLEPERISARTQMKEVSASAYVYRMFELFFFHLRDPLLTARLQERERSDVDEFLRIFDALPWRPLSTHPHISELEDDDLGALVPLARRVDRHLLLRTGRGFFPLVYRLFHGWPLFEPASKAKEVANRVAGSD